MATITARLPPDVLQEVREAQQVGCATVAEAIDEAIRLCLPSAIVNIDAEATAITIAVKDADLVRSLISLGLDEYACRYAPKAEPAAPDVPAESGGLKELIGAIVAPLVAKPA
jgi:hypothetical protein